MKCGLVRLLEMAQTKQKCDGQSHCYIWWDPCPNCRDQQRIVTAWNQAAIREALDGGYVENKFACGYRLTPEGEQLLKQLKGDFS